MELFLENSQLLSLHIDLITFSSFCFCNYFGKVKLFAIGKLKLFALPGGLSPARLLSRSMPQQAGARVSLRYSARQRTRKGSEME